MWGRRRRLPDIQLPKYVVTEKGAETSSLDFNPLIGSLNLYRKVENPKVSKYLKLLNEAKGLREIESVKKNANMDNISIKDNSGFISRAERQCVNARVQGGAATMSKRAMIKVHHDEELRRLGFRLMLAVHDELIGECPEENADAVASRLCDIMKVAALPECVVPFKCDPTIEGVWYEDDYSNVLRQEYKNLCETMSKEEAFNKIKLTHCECTDAQLTKFLMNS
jgi:DNA polymerase I-like protein with 3'-5' exonuclease and polymerase domains